MRCALSEQKKNGRFYQATGAFRPSRPTASQIKLPDHSLPTPVSPNNEYTAENWWLFGRHVGKKASIWCCDWFDGALEIYLANGVMAVLRHGGWSCAELIAHGKNRGAKSQRLGGTSWEIFSKCRRTDCLGQGYDALISLKECVWRSTATPQPDDPPYKVTWRRN